jgi:DNA repair exonuclease SbcCD nuclease subunit
MLTLLWRSDVHLADVAPQARIDDWVATILGKIIQIGQIAKEVGASAVLDGGDFFHVKSPTRNSHELVAKTALVHAAYPCPVYATVGNHDVKYGNLEFLPEAPLETLFSTGVFQRLYDQHEVTFTKDDITVRVVGIPYHGTKYDLNRFSEIKKGSEDYLVVVAHCLASPKETTMFEAEDVLSYKDLSAYAPDAYLMGHWHKDQGVQRVAGKLFVNVGSVSRGSLQQDELERIPTVVALYFDKDDISYSKIELQISPASEVFDLAGRARVEKREETVDSLVEKLLGLMTMRDGESLLNKVRSLPLEESVRELVMGYLEKVGAK